jgi:hypothetical protein
MSVLRRMPKMRQTAALVAPSSSGAGPAILWWISAAWRHSVPGLSAYATKIGRSLVPAINQKFLQQSPTVYSSGNPALRRPAK